MAGFVDRIRGATRGSGQANGPENAASNPGTLIIGKLIGAGGEGAVYEDRNDPHMVIKVLHQQHATPERSAKLEAMCNNPPQNAQALSWPDAVETNTGGIRYRMPRASGKAGTAYRFISANERRHLPERQQEYEYRTRIGVKIAEAFRWLHTIHVRIGDVNPSNILVSDDGSVMLIDCDSFQIPGPPGHQPYPCVVGSPEYTAPEIDDFRRQFRSQDSDNFALAVLLYQLLGNGSHPYQGVDASAADAVSSIRERIKGHRFAHQPQGGLWRPTPGQVRSWRAMPEAVRNAFRQAFSPGAPHIGRPTADAWASILDQNPRPTPIGEQQTAQPTAKASIAPPAWQVGPSSAPELQTAPLPKPHPVLSNPIPRKPTPLRPTFPAMERVCPKCKSRDARLRRDWHKRYNALRCRNCNEVFARTLIKRCPNCASQEARLRRDWHSRGRPFRCLKCKTVFGGTDQILPAEPVVGRTPNLVRYLAESTATVPKAGQIIDRARGVMLGVVVGNLLGLPVEGWSVRHIRESYPTGVREIRSSELKKPMDDDPAQSVELAEALLEGGDLVERFTARLIAWSLLNGRGMGRTTRQSINQPKDKVPPPVAAYAVYRTKGEIAPNGGIMRCAPVAIARRRHPELLVRDTADTCAVSHYAPASQWSCIVVNAVISVLLGGGVPDIQKLLTAARADGCPDQVGVAQGAGVPTSFLEDAVRGRSSPVDTKWMRGNRGPKGHTVLTMQAGLWAATTPLGFDEALVEVVNAGGDTDTNGALAGAVLGARYGASAIQSRWISQVSQRERLEDLADRLVRL